MNIEKIDSLKLANSIPSENDKTNMIAKLVCETADMQRKIDDLLIQNTEWKLENERLNTNLEVANEDLTIIARLLNLEEGCTIYDIEDKIEKLQSIIKEVREYIEKNIVDYITNYDDLRQELLEILDKVGSDKE